MKRFILLAAMLFAFHVSAQEDEELTTSESEMQSDVTSGEGEEEVDPNAYFIEHKVMMGEKIHMISRKYMVDPFDIYEYNDAVNGVEAGTVLYIPLHKSHKKDLEKFKEELIKKNGGNPIQVAAPAKREKELLYPDEEEGMEGE
ncbi:MAG TPA: hypothetical protein VEA37_08970 [Flavobacterium sp.]|nr:hypothetical protein [Flavobacterium sp.]